METKGVFVVKYVGLDGEMTGNDGPDVHQLIQVGLATTEAVLVSDIGYQPGQYETQPEALAVCRFTPERIESGPPADEVDARITEWLDDVFPGVQPWPVGFGVSYFDLPYVRKYLPKTWARLNKRTMDLTAICQYLEDASIQSGAQRDFKYWMNSAKGEAEKVLGRAGWHDAGYDAQAAIFSYRWLTERLADTLQCSAGAS